MDHLVTPVCLLSWYTKRYIFKFICVCTISNTIISKIIENVMTKKLIQGNFCCKTSRFPDKRLEMDEINVTWKKALNQETEFFFKKYFFRIVALIAIAYIYIEQFLPLFEYFWYSFLVFCWLCWWYNKFVWDEIFFEIKSSTKPLICSVCCNAYIIASQILHASWLLTLF